MKITNYFLLLLLVLCLNCNSSHKITQLHSENEDINESISVSLMIDQINQPYRDSISAIMNQIIGNASEKLTVGCPEGTLGNYITDLVLYSARLKFDSTALCILNNGGFRTNIEKGQVSIGNIFELMPFENELVLVKLNSTTFKELQAYILKKSLEEPSRKAGAPVSGLTMSIKNGSIAHFTLNTSIYNSTSSYWIVTTDYLAGGGDHMEFMTNAEKTIPLNIKLRDVIIDYIHMHPQISPILDQRISHVQ